MKSNLTKVSLALVSAVFLLGCQDQGSGPVGPDGLGPQFAKGGKPGKPGGGRGGGGGGALSLFDRPGGLNAVDGYTCGGGAASSRPRSTR